MHVTHSGDDVTDQLVLPHELSGPDGGHDVPVGEAVSSALRIDRDPRATDVCPAAFDRIDGLEIGGDDVHAEVEAPLGVG